MKTKLLLLMMVLLGIAAGAQAVNVKIGNYELEVGDYFSRESGLIGLESGYIYYDDASHLTLENVELCFNNVEGLSAAILYLGGHLTITLIGENKIYGAAIPNGIISLGLTIDGTGSLDVVGTYSGLYMADQLSNLVIDNAHVKTKGDTYGIRGIGTSGWDDNGPNYKSTGLRIHGDGILEVYGGTQCFYAIDGRGASSAAITSPSGAKFSDSGSVVDASNNPIKNQWVTLKNGYLVDSTNFPDANFRNWVLAQSYGKDGLLTDAEIANVTSINIYSKNIANLKGIEFFTALKSLNCRRNHLATLDVSKNTLLTNLDCTENYLTSLDVSKNTALTELRCDNNRLTALDVSKNTKLEVLQCYVNQLTSLDISKNTNLTDLRCGNNQLTALDISTNTKLEGLMCDNNQLTTLDVSKNTALLLLWCDNNQLTTLDVSKNKVLESLICYCNKIRGAGMQTLVNNLYDRSTLSYGSLNVYYDETPEGNEMTVLQVEAAKLKNWKVEMYSNGDLVDYPGVVTTITLDKTEAILEKTKTMTLKATVSPEIENKSVTWKSSNTAVATVSSTGKVKGVKAGIVTITCTSKATGESATCQVTVGYVKLNKTEAILQKTKTMTLTPTVYPSVLEDKSVTWKSSKTTVATVSSNGEVTGVKAGTAVITCTSNATGLSTSCTVTVGYVKLDKTEAVLEKYKTMTLTPTVYPSALEDKSVTWKSSDTKIATVSSNGEVTGVKAGFVTITCTSNATGLSTACTVTVGYVKLDKTEAILEKYKTMMLKPTVYPSALEDRSVTWKSSDTKIATVSSNGEVTGVKAGTVVITSTSNATGLSASCTITVGYVKLNKTEAILEKYKTMTLTATVYPSALEDRSVTWKSSNTAVATVSSTGEVTGVKAGTAVITSTSNATGLSTTCTVTVGYVKLDKTEVFLKKGKTLTLTPTVYPSALEDRSVTWKSSDTKIATVTSAGKVKGVKSGTATITCTSNATGLSTTCKVTVGTVILNMSEIAVNKGKTVTLEADVYPETLTDKSVTWESSDETVATVSRTGKVTGIAAGTATITCTSVATGLSSTCKVTVTEFTPARTLLGGDEEVTGIETVEEMPAAEEPFDVYDLRGRKVLHQVTSLDGLPAGVYIVNGKKMLKK